MKFPDEAMLGRTPPFRRLGSQQLREALDLAEIRCLGVRAAIFDEGQPARRFHLLLSGHIRFARLTSEGYQIIMLHVPAGQMFGIGAALRQSTHQNSAITASPCVVLSWSNALWPVFSQRYDGFAAESLCAFGARADEMSTRIVELSTKLADQRIACVLLRMVTQSGRKVTGGIEIDFPVTRQIIADMTGTTLHTVSRILAVWQRRGILKSTRCLIVVTDPHRLALLCGGAGATEHDGTAISAQTPYATPMIPAARSLTRNTGASGWKCVQTSVAV